MSQQNPSAVGQVSADGQFRWDGAQWVPIPKGTREPTAWTRPMQLAVAALCVVQGLLGIAFTFLYANHDNILSVLQAQGTQIPQGMTEDSLVNLTIGVAIAESVIIGLILLGVALGSVLGWRWMFWVALVGFGLGGLFGIFGLGVLTNSHVTSYLPSTALVLNELLEIADLALFVWLLVGVIKFGPWALKKPGA